MGEDLASLSRTLGDRYVIERELGRGGMGAVYLARDRRLDRPVALKVLPPEFATVVELRERFLRETRLAAGFSHPNIVPVFAIEETDDVLAFAMGFVEGESLSARVAREGPLSQRDAVRLLQDVGYALAYAHGRGVVHRDIKPDNIMIERATGRALVMDFGIARAITAVPDKPGLTRVGEVVGTPEYMSPEQAAGESVDGRADLYSLGLVAWFALAGTTAVTGETTQRILVKQLTEAVPPLAGARADLPRSLTDVVDRCCAKEPGDRYQSAEALVESLDAAQLASPDVPVAIRLLAPELSSVIGRGLTGLATIGIGIVKLMGDHDANVLAIGLIVIATAWVMLLNALRDVRRLCAGGYAVGEVQRLLALTLSEKDDERARRAADPQLVKRRRTRVFVAIGVLLWQGGLIVALRLRSETANVRLSGTAATISFFASLLASAVAIAVLLSSPFRRSIAERLFALTWLGRVGHGILSLAAGRARGAVLRSPAARRVMPPDRTPTPAPPAPVSNALDQLAHDVRDLRARVSALESRR